MSRNELAVSNGELVVNKSELVASEEKVSALQERVTHLLSAVHADVSRPLEVELGAALKRAEEAEAEAAAQAFAAQARHRPYVSTFYFSISFLSRFVHVCGSHNPVLKLYRILY